ncbi:MAG TPA: hypothetical protein VL485_15065 [Ktedonobacteraceae bacterium]|jgi:hypothetical protein|nr:hypothetical protein [Ktedonobacteraceae bacterium]
MHEPQLENSQNKQDVEHTIEYTGKQTAPSLLHQTLHRIWPEQIEDDDLELLDVSLYHLFHNLNLLIQEILPQLAEISAQAEAAQYTQDIRARQMRQYHIWIWLSEMRHRLERIEPLCQIVTITVSYLLIAIDTNKPATLQKSHQQILYTRARQYEQQLPRALTTDEHAYYVQGLQTWQDLTAEPHKLQAFSHLFSDLSDGQSYLMQMDSALVEIYRSAQTIFSSILRTCHTTTLPAPTMLLLLLDLQQHADILQQHIDTFLTPLHVLLKRYAPLVELR